jgi:hypothetical protein
MTGDWKMGYVPRERLGIFLILISFWYLINIKIFNALNPVLAVPASTIFIIGLWLSLSLPIPTTRTSTYVPVEIPVEAEAKPEAETTPMSVSEPTQKPTKKSKSKLIKKTKPSQK